MKRRLYLFPVLLVTLALLFSGCGGTRKYRPSRPYKPKTEVHEKGALARKYFQAGKEDYLNFKFYDSIRKLQRAIAYEISDTSKANCYLYIGANYFYLKNFRQARYSFSQAKKYNHALRPPRSEFPWEIIRLYKSTP